MRPLTNIPPGGSFPEIRSNIAFRDTVAGGFLLLAAAERYSMDPRAAKRSRHKNTDTFIDPREIKKCPLPTCAWEPFRPPSHCSPQPAAARLAQKKYDTGATDTEIKIGNIMPYSGPASAYGVIGKTEDAYFKKINAEGGINGRKINFISYDDAYSPPKTVEQARKLVESDEVLLVFNPLGTPPNTAIQKYLNTQEGAATVRRHRRHQVERSEGLPLDHGLAAQLPERSPRSMRSTF